MKKRKLKRLRINKKSISNFDINSMKGGKNSAWCGYSESPPKSCFCGDPWTVA